MKILDDNNIRLTSDVVLLISFFLLPWWFTILFAFTLMLLIRNYFEAVVVGIFFDFLYAGSPESSREIFISLTCFFVIALVIVEFVRPLIWVK